MAAKSRPYEQFGPYILFKKLEADALGDLWRAARIDGTQLGPLVAVRRLTGGDREALSAAALAARELVPQMTGTSFAKNQVIDVLNGVPFIAHDYAGGRSLRHIVDRARGGAGVTPNPIPIEQAIVIAERVALSLDTLGNMRSGQTKLTHGALIPQFVWITDDGEIRVGGQMLGPGLIPSLKKDPKVGAELGRYFPPEYRESGEAQKTSAVYGAGAILFLVVTGQEPPDAASGSAFAQAIRATKTMTGTPIPDDILPIIEKSLALDPAARYASIGELKQALSQLVHGGKYSASTFNLAFYMSNLLKKELEGEAIDREREAKVNVAAYVDAPAAAAAEPSTARSTPNFGVSDEPPSKSKAPLAIAAVLILAAIGGGAFYMLRGKPATPAPAANLASAAAPVAPARPKIVSEPVMATSTVATATTASVDPAAQKKAFEDAVNQKMQEELMRLQDEYTRNLQKQQSKNAPVPTPPPTPAPAAVAAVAEERAPSAAQLDQSRQQQQQPRVETPTPAPAVVAQSQPAAPAVAAPAPTPQAPAIREGDVVDVSSLDTVPRIVRGAKPQYPVMAQRQRVETTVLLTVLITETGDVADVRVLRGDPRFGFEDSAIRAARNTRFSPGIKDGKRVKTWFPIPFLFKL
jgi:protein TonB